MDKKDKGGVADNPIAYPKHYPKQVVMDKKELGRDMWYQVGDKRYASIEGEEYIRVSDVQQEIDRAKEEERSKTLLELIAIFGEWEHPLTFDSNYVQKFLGEEINNLTK